MKNGIKSVIRTIFRKFGIEVCRYNPRTSDEAKLLWLFSHFGIDLILDIGANVGQFP